MVCEERRRAKSAGSVWLLSALALVLALAVVLRLAGLEQNGFGRLYYAAGVRSMLGSAHNFLYGAFDPAGFLSLDKPPLAIWLQVAGAKLLGFSGISILLPQVLVGLVSVALLFHLVRRAHGDLAALLAALVLALTPVSVAVDRSNNTESLLIALLLVATWMAVQAAETGRLAWLTGAMATIGLAFNVKMGAALVLAPVLALAFSAAHRNRPLGWHITRHAAAGLGLLAVALSWVTLFDLTPASQRPYAGSTRGNSMLELALVHNGAARFLAPVRGTGNARTSLDEAAASEAARPELTDTTPTGPLRLFRPRQAAQAAWLLPLVITGLVIMWRASSSRVGAPSAVPHALAIIWTGWLALYWVVLSAAGGPVHTYYIAVLAPPLAALAGIALADVWQRWGAGVLRAPPMLLLVAALVAWQATIFFGQVGLGPDGWLVAIWAGASALILLAALALLVAQGTARPVGPLAASVALAALLVLPAMAALSVVLVRPNVAAPFADIAALTRPVDPRPAEAVERFRAAARAKLIAYLVANRSDARFLLAVPNAVVAAPMIVASGEPVMAMGGYLGDDPILTPAVLAEHVAAGRLRFVMLGGFTLAPDRRAALGEIEAFVRANGRPVDPEHWQIRRPGQGETARTVRLGNALVAMPPPELFDLRPAGR